MTDQFIDYWNDHQHTLLPDRRQKMERVAAARTDQLALVVQDVHDPHNVAACLRSAEACGVLNVYIVTTRKPKRSAAARGCSHWLNIHSFTTIEECAVALKTAGYRIAGGFPCEQARSLGEVPVGEKLAVVFGNEHEGIGSGWIKHLDYPFTIPMYGMVESFNISVAAAISLYDLSSRGRAQLGSSYHLQQKPAQQLLGKWLHSRLRSPQQSQGASAQL